MKRVPIVITLILLFTVAALAQSPAEAMLAANRLYEAGEFAPAAEAYQNLIDQGLADSAVYYNLGNAWFKQGDLGRAILNYRRAELLAPRDADIRANLLLARGQTVDQLKSADETFLSRLAVLAQTWLTLNEMAVAALFLWAVLVVLIIIYSRLPSGPVKKAAYYAAIVCAVFLLAGIISMGSRLYVERTRPAAVIIASEVPVTSGPGEQYITEFSLHSGAEVSLIETRGQWARLILPGGKLQGWIPAQAVAAVGN